MSKIKDCLKILLLSDIHQQVTYLEKLEQWYLKQKHSLVFDYVFISGDTGVVQYKEGVEINREQQIDSEKVMVEILKKLQVYDCPILYIPGNHDCEVQFKDKVLTKNSHNLHKKSFKLAQDLNIIGFGGSLPGYVKGQLEWVGYPFKNERQFKSEFQQFNSEGHDHQFILMTHVGPASSSTTIDSHELQKQIHSGSSTLLNYISKQSKKCVLNIHGHTHQARGFGQLHCVPILNPGAIAKGNFGTLNLVRKQKWGVQSFQLLDLNLL